MAARRPRESATSHQGPLGGGTADPHENQGPRVPEGDDDDLPGGADLHGAEEAPGAVEGKEADRGRQAHAQEGVEGKGV
ncbi:hypothetical protein GCM10018777_70160 [Streptomyces albogriseolus]|nr:hypothetical protein GCM10018777_70160 [Streptomyces viridodiastaticus]